MKIHPKKVVLIMIVIVIFEIICLVGLCISNKATVNSEEKIATIENFVSEDEMKIENENLISKNKTTKCDLTNNEGHSIIIMDDESNTNNFTLEDILINECPFYVIDEIYEIDSYVEGNWYCYYIYADGDVYVITTKNGHVDICEQLN